MASSMRQCCCGESTEHNWLPWGSGGAGFGIYSVTKDGLFIPAPYYPWLKAEVMSPPDAYTSRIRVRMYACGVMGLDVSIALYAGAGYANVQLDFAGTWGGGAIERDDLPSPAAQAEYDAWRVWGHRWTARNSAPGSPLATIRSNPYSSGDCNAHPDSFSHTVSTGTDYVGLNNHQDSWGSINGHHYANCEWIVDARVYYT